MEVPDAEVLTCPREPKCRGRMAAFKHHVEDLRKEDVKQVQSIYCYNGAPHPRRTKHYLSDVVEDGKEDKM